jgi:hypothetical protein
MLMFVIEEWSKDNSNIFKGYNKYKEISNDDSRAELLKKIRKNIMLYIIYI